MGLVSDGMIVGGLAAMPELGEDDALAGRVDARAAVARAQPAPLGAVAAVQLVPVPAHLQQRPVARARCPHIQSTVNHIDIIHRMHILPKY